MGSHLGLPYVYTIILLYPPYTPVCMYIDKGKCAKTGFLLNTLFRVYFSQNWLIEM